MLILTTRQLDITLEFFFFILLLQVLVIWSLCSCVIAVKVIVSACEDGVRLNYIRLILSRKEPYTSYAEN